MESPGATGVRLRTGASVEVATTNTGTIAKPNPEQQERQRDAFAPLLTIARRIEAGLRRKLAQRQADMRPGKAAELARRADALRAAIAAAEGGCDG